MRLENTFTVPAPVPEAWQRLLDVPWVAPCMPGATLTDFDGETFTGTVKVTLGPISLTYRGSGRIASRDEDTHRTVIEASGRETRGPGTATATLTATLTPDGGSTRVDVVTDLTVTGRPAQFGRGMLSDVSTTLIGQFADCLATELRPTGPVTEAPSEPATAAVPSAASPPVGQAPPAPVEPIDLWAVTGAQVALRRAVPYLAAFTAGGLLTWLVLRRRRR